MRKKSLFLLLAAVFMLVFAACGSDGEETTDESVATSEETSVAESTVEESEETEESTAPEAKTLRLTTTTSVNDSGLMEYLREPLKEATGIDMEIVSKGSGAAIEDGRQGNADVILVHSPAAEQEFVDEGYGKERQSFMHNYFVIVGPAEDPAGIQGKTAEEAFQAIADSGSPFASRGDESGTHTKELSIWKGAGLEQADIEGQDWYNSLGDGMGATLTFACEKQAYTLTDLSTFLSNQNDLNLEVLVDESDSLKNVYSVIVVNPDQVEGTDVETADRFAEWITGDEAAELIKVYGEEEYGQPLFFIGE